MHGNYSGYYTKRGLNFLDPRLRVLPSDVFSGKRVLDIGCNEGWVTCDIARNYGASEVIGVDIDPKLISRAWRHRRDVWSQQAPSSCLEREQEEHDPALGLTYFPESFSSLFGPIPIPTRTTSFPNNVLFHTNDWANNGCSADTEGYDVVVAFSVSKWIHVNGGDDGLKTFFTRIRDVLRCRSPDTRGIFILEAQPWSGYRSAMRKANVRSTNVTINPDDFPSLLAELGFSEPVRAEIVGEGGFKRPVDVYRLGP